MRILSIVGARPQFVKAAAFRQRCAEQGLEELLADTGQHYDPEMSTNIFSALKVKMPEFSLNVENRSHAGMTGELMLKIENLITDVNPDIVNVYGDTNSTLAGALAAAKLNVPIMHIEAGLRSFNKQMPEEVNRVLTDHVSQYLFCPTTKAVENLKSESITKGVYPVGDIMFDAIKMFGKYFDFPEQISVDRNRPLAVLTIHRADAVSSAAKLKELVDYCQQFTHEFEVIFPVHPNTKKHLTKYQIDTGKLLLTEPLSYLEMQGLLRESDLVLTDSGGLQKEAYFHGSKCITLREETEWVETIEAGWNRLWRDPCNHEGEPKEIKEYGDGNTANKIIETLKRNSA